MGHYSDLYEAEAEESDRKMRLQCKVDVEKEMNKMSTDNLRLLVTISRAIESFRIVFTIITSKN